MIIKSIT